MDPIDYGFLRFGEIGQENQALGQVGTSLAIAMLTPVRLVMAALWPEHTTVTSSLISGSRHCLPQAEVAGFFMRASIAQQIEGFCAVRQRFTHLDRQIKLEDVAGKKRS